MHVCMFDYELTVQYMCIHTYYRNQAKFLSLRTCVLADLGRSAVEKCDGIKTLLSLLQALLSSKHDGAEKLRTIACGFLLNLTNSNGENLVVKA